jgi:hypothetical protein
MLKNIEPKEQTGGGIIDKLLFVIEQTSNVDLIPIITLFADPQYTNTYRIEQLLGLLPNHIVTFITKNPLYNVFMSHINKFNITDVFFPLWVLSQVEPGMDDQLDNLGLMIDSADFMLGLLSPFLNKLLDSGFDVLLGSSSIVLDAGQAIPGIGSAISILSVGQNILNTLGSPAMDIFSDVLLESLDYTIDIIGLLINISRKQWDLAFISLTNLIPDYADYLDFYITFTYKINKTLIKISKQNIKLQQILLPIQTSLKQSILILTNLKKYLDTITIVLKTSTQS